MNYTRKLQDLGKALQTIHDFNKNNVDSEGVKARFNHYVSGLLVNMNADDKNIVFSEMNFSYLDELGALGDK